MPKATKRDGRTCAYPPCSESTEAGSNYCPAHADREKLFAHMYRKQSSPAVCTVCGSAKGVYDGKCKDCFAREPQTVGNWAAK